jgi:hypothetical protein
LKSFRNLVIICDHPPFSPPSGKRLIATGCNSISSRCNTAFACIAKSPSVMMGRSALRGGATDVTDWLTWFLACLGRATHRADGVLAAVIAKAQFWERAAALALNDR